MRSVTDRLAQRNGGVALAQGAPRGEATFDDQFGFDPKKSRIPEDDVRYLAWLEGTDEPVDAVRPRGIDRVVARYCNSRGLSWAGLSLPSRFL
jgi:hypothetical protein